MLASVEAWFHANPAIWYPVLTAVFSIAYTFLDKFPRIHAIFAALAGLGLDLPRVLAMIQKAATGKEPPTAGPSAPPGPTSADLKTVPPPPPAPPVATRVATRTMRPTVLVALTVAIAFVLVFCGGSPDLGPTNPAAIADYGIDLANCRAKAKAMRDDAGMDSGWYEMGLDCYRAEHEKRCGDGGIWSGDAIAAGVCDGGILPLKGDE